MLSFRYLLLKTRIDCEVRKGKKVTKVLACTKLSQILDLNFETNIIEREVLKLRFVKENIENKLSNFIGERNKQHILQKLKRKN